MAVAGTALVLVVVIAENALKTLREGGLSLGVSQKVNDEFNIVWEASDLYFGTNYYEWQRNYRVFGELIIDDGPLQNATTESQSILPGQTCLLDADGILHPAEGEPNESGKYSINSQFPGRVLAGMQITQSPGEDFTIYLSTDPFVVGLFELQPNKIVRVWFQRGIATGARIENAPDNYIDVDFTDATSQTVNYTDDGVWVLNSEQ